MINKKLREKLTLAMCGNADVKNLDKYLKQIKEVIVSELEGFKKTGGNGAGCTCGARNWSECGCDNVDWNDYKLVNKAIDDIVNKFKEE